MGAHQDALQSAVVTGFGMVGALMNGALDALVCVVHGLFLLFLGFTDSMSGILNLMHRMNRSPCKTGNDSAIDRFWAAKVICCTF